MIVVYSDINISDNAHTKGKELVYNYASCDQSIGTIFSVAKGETFFLRNFGTDWEEVLWKPMTAQTELFIFQRLIEAIELWDPRYRVDTGKSNVTAWYERYLYEVEMYYLLKGFENEGPFQITGEIPVKYGKGRI